MDDGGEVEEFAVENEEDDDEGDVVNIESFDFVILLDIDINWLVFVVLLLSCLYHKLVSLDSI
jgi:hypothetical protein